MAKVVLANGKDVDRKKLAQVIIAAQEKEIATIDAWLRKKEHSGSELSPNFGDGRWVRRRLWLEVSLPRFHRRISHWR